MHLRLKIPTLLRLGLRNVARVYLYRVGLRSGLHPALRIRSDITGNKFFRDLGAKKSHYSDSAEGLPPSEVWTAYGLYFGRHRTPSSDRPPQWHLNPFSGTRVFQPDRPWWNIPDFDPKVGDIKVIWEASRFDWVVAMAQRAKAGDKKELVRLNDWLANWCDHNPAFKGPNWKCGQEASIRIIHLAVAARLLGQHLDPQPDLLRLIKAHLKRIYPTVSYAIGQDNNHGTSEAVALFIGGHWCFANGHVEGLKWARTGKRLLENRVKRLIQTDGSFSQHSVNYHRLMLDTLSIAELWRRWHDLDPFSSLFYKRAIAATDWLYSLVDPKSGDAPNLGSNDGARIIPLVDSDYRDFRPTVQLAKALFEGQRAYTDSSGYHDDHLRWLEVPLPTSAANDLVSTQHDVGGYAVLRLGTWMVLFRYPRYRFRPSHCDALHVDLWHGSMNVLRDSGSYSYNTEPELQSYFSGTEGHNTIQFDDRDQMPRLSRFLRGGWLQSRDVLPLDESENVVAVSAGYQDWQGALHHRHVELHSHGIVVRDRVAGFKQRAILRWRLMPGEWLVEGHSIRMDKFLLCVQANVDITRFEIVEGWESRYYLEKTRLPVLEIEVESPGTLTTDFKEIVK